MDVPAIAILADDLIWSTRLADLVKAAGRRPLTVRSVPDLEKALQTVTAVIVDLTARAYDGIAAVEIAHHSDHPVLCVGQHDDRELRARALEAGADRVVPYRLLFERGIETVTAWLATPRSAAAQAAAKAGGADA
jgi:DNA-binding response OmpR family regulator